MTDLGTEFGMYVGKTGTAEVHVFTGSVDVALAPPPEAPVGTARQTVRLVQDEALLCAPGGGTPQRMAAAAAEFVQTTTTLALAVAEPQPVPRPPDVLSDLSGHWTLDGILDNAADGPPGKLVGGTPEYVPGRNGALALQLFGNDQHIFIPYDSRDDAVTVSIWVRPTSTANQNIMVLSDPEGPQHQYTNQLRIENGRFSFYAFDGQQHLITGTTRIVPGTWYLVTGTAVSGGQLRLYVNGAPEGEIVNISRPLHKGDRYLIGGKSIGWTPETTFVVVDSFAGLAADARVYRRALDPAEVSTLFAAAGGDSNGGDSL